MTELLKRVHIWIGLFNFTVLIVFAVTGIAVTLPQRTQASPRARLVDYETPGSLTDKEVADDLHGKLALPLSQPIPEWALQRNEANALVLEFDTPNGRHKVTVLESENKLQIEHTRNAIGEFMNAMHATTFLSAAPDVRLKLWALYIDASILSLMFMSVTGVWLWLSSRVAVWWAWAALAMGGGLFAVLWLATR